MAHFAQLDENNIVTQVIVVSNDDTMKNGVEDENTGIQFCKNLLGQNTRWVQTSYNHNFRVRYAGIGYTYDEEHDAFIAPSPFPSWVLNTETLAYEAPVPQPESGMYMWDEATLSWVSLESPPSKKK